MHVTSILPKKHIPEQTDVHQYRRLKVIKNHLKDKGIMLK